MKRDNNLILFLLGMFSIFSFMTIHSNRKSRLKELNQLHNKINNGFKVDAKNLVNDWRNIEIDHEKAKKKLLEHV